MNLARDVWDAFTSPFANGPQQTWQTIKLAMSALALAAVAGLTLGVAATRFGRVGSYVIQAIGHLGRMVPTLGIMALVAALWTIGFWPAVIALIALGIAPILLNTYTGIRDVDPTAIGAARGMGLTSPQILLKVSLPLAAPLIFAGLRTATNEVIATAALGAFVGADGLGVIIQSGLGNLQTAELLAGAIPIAALALTTDGLLAVVERTCTPKGLRLARRQAKQQGRLA